MGQDSQEYSSVGVPKVFFNTSWYLDKRKLGLEDNFMFVAQIRIGSPTCNGLWYSCKTTMLLDTLKRLCSFVYYLMYFCMQMFVSTLAWIINASYLEYVWSPLELKTKWIMKLMHYKWKVIMNVMHESEWEVIWEWFGN